MVLLCALKRSRTALFSVWPVILASYFGLQATASSSTRLFASHRAHNYRNGGNVSIGAEDEQENNILDPLLLLTMLYPRDRSLSSR